MFQARIVGDEAFRCDWVETHIPIQRCLMFIITAANKESQLTAEQFLPVSNVIMFKVCSRVKLPVTNNTEHVYSDIRLQVIYFVILYSNEAKLPRGFCMP